MYDVKEYVKDYECQIMSVYNFKNIKTKYR